jgi:hypothetical protein
MRPIQKAAVILGGGYLAVGVIGFAVTGFSGLLDHQGSMLIVFHVNPFHNIVHIGIGALLLLAARMPDEGPLRGAPEGAFLGIGSFYTLAAVLGYFGVIQLLAVPPGVTPVTLLHLGTGLAALVITFTLGDWDMGTRTKNQSPTRSSVRV